MHKVTHLYCGKNDHGETRVWDNYGRIVENVRAFAVCSSMVGDDMNWTAYFVFVNAEDQESYLHGVRRLAREEIQIGEKVFELLFRTEFDSAGFPGVQLITLPLAETSIAIEAEFVGIDDDGHDIIAYT